MKTENLPFSFQICLLGKLDEERAGWFSEVIVTTDAYGNSILSGQAADQSALLGILLRAHNLNLLVRSFRRMGTDEVDEMEAR